MGIIKGVF